MTGQQEQRDSIMKNLDQAAEELTADLPEDGEDSAVKVRTTPY